MRRETGFTLIEVLVALTIGAIVVLMVRQGFDGASDLAARLDAEAAPHQARMEARMFLARAFGSLEIGTPGTHGFEGLPDGVTFSTALDAGPPIDVTIVAEDGVLIARETGGTAGTLDSASDLACDYLLAYGGESRWVREWRSPASAPLAARLRIGRRDGAVDTLLLVIGPRG